MGEKALVRLCYFREMTGTAHILVQTACPICHTTLRYRAFVRLRYYIFHIFDNRAHQLRFQDYLRTLMRMASRVSGVANAIFAAEHSQSGPHVTQPTTTTHVLPPSATLNLCAMFKPSPSLTRKSQ